MKRKVAILLALVMVITMLPMNVFGARGTVSPLLADPNGRDGDNWSTTIFNAHVDLEEIARLPVANTQALYLRFTLNGERVHFHRAPGDENGLPGWPGLDTTQDNNNWGHMNDRLNPNAKQRALNFRSDIPGWVDLTTPNSLTAQEFADLLNDSFDETLAGGNSHPLYPFRWSQSANEIIVPFAVLETDENPALNEKLILGDLLQNLQGRLPVQMRVHAGSRDATLTIELLRQVATTLSPVATLLDNAPLVAAGRPGGVTIEAGASVSIGSYGRLNPITIRENTPKNLTDNNIATNPVAVRLTAPRGFDWRLDEIAGIAGGNFEVTGNSRVMQHLVGVGEHDRGEFRGKSEQYVTAIRRNPAGLSELYLIFAFSGEGEKIDDWRNPFERQSGVYADTNPIELRLENLWLVATTDGAGDELHVNVEIGSVEVGPNLLNEHIGGTLPNNTVFRFERDTRAPGDSGINPAWGSGRPPQTENAGNISALTGRNRSGGDWAANLRIGQRGNPTGITVHGPELGEDDELNWRWSGQRTSDGQNSQWIQGNAPSITIREDAPGALFSTVDNWEFRLVQEGVTFLAAREWLETNNNLTNDNWGNRVGGSGLEVLHERTDNLDANRWVNPRVYRLTTLPVDGHIVSRHLRLGFELNIQGDYVARNGTDLVEVEVYRNGQLVENSRVAIATVRDRITVEIVGNPTMIDRTGIDFLPITMLPTVRITENYPGALQAGRQLHVHLVTKEMEIGQEVNIPLMDPTLSLDRTSLGYNIVQRGRTLTNVATSPSNLDVRAFVFDVVGQSSNDNNLISIELDLAMLGGLMMPNIGYFVAVGGDAVVRNELYQQQSVNPNTIRNLSFDTASYTTLAGEISGDFAVDTTPTPPPTTSPTTDPTQEPTPITPTVPVTPEPTPAPPVALSAGNVFNSSVGPIQNPFRNVAGGGVVSFRAIGEILGWTLDWNGNADTNPGGDGGPMWATFTDPATGTVVRVQANSSTATVNGVNVPMVNNDGAPVQAVVLDGNRFFVPIRFFDMTDEIPISIEWFPGPPQGVNVVKWGN